MTAPHTSFFSLKTQFENLGDALINRDLILLAARNGTAVVDLSRCPPSFRTTMDLDNLPQVHIVKSTGALFWRLVAHRLRGRPAAWYLSPGGYFGELSAKEQLRRTPQALIIAAMAIGGVQINHIGVSYERLGTRHIRFLRRRMRFISNHFTRDAQSARYLQDQGLRVDGVLPDLAFSLFDRAPLDRATRGRIALCFRGDQYTGQTQDVASFLIWVQAHLPPQVPQPPQFRFVVQVKRDLEVARKLSAALRDQGMHVPDIVECYGNLAACQEAYVECDMVIGNRLHGLLIGSSENGHLLACISGNENAKIIGLFDKMGLADQIIALDRPRTNEDKQILARAFSNLFDGRAQRAELEQGMDTIQKGRV